MRHKYSRPEGSFFAFSKAERVYTFVAAALACVLMTVPYWWPILVPPADPPQPTRGIYAEEIEAWVAEVEALEDSLRLAQSAKRQAYRSYRKKSTRKTSNRSWQPATKDRNARRWETAIDLARPLPPVESLDPNTVDSATLLRIGIPPFLAGRWLKFRRRGGTFVRRADVSKLYDLPDSTFTRIRAFFVDGVDLHPGFAEPRPRGMESPVIVEVNQASEKQLTAIRGIGPFYAKQIVRYRDRLGGFTAVAQIAETPKLPDSTFQAVRSRMRVDTFALDVLDINNWPVKRLARHPYLTYAQAQTLVDYRRNHGAYLSTDDLYDVIVLDSATVQRLVPYLDL